MGCIAYSLGTAKFRRAYGWLATAAMALIFLVITLNLFSDRVSISIVCACTALILYFYTKPAHGDLLYRALSLPASVYVGKISYGIYLYHWPWLVLAAATIGTSPVTTVVVVLLTTLCAIISFHLIELPIRNASSDLVPARVMVLFSAPTAIVAIVLFSFFPRFSQSDNSLLARVFNIPARENWPELRCHGTAKNNVLDELNVCLSSTKSTSLDVFLIGDSHAAQLWFPLKSLADSNNVSLYFINTQRTMDFPFSMWLEGDAKDDRILSHLHRVADEGDTIVIAFFRGYFNAKFDRHVEPGDVEIQNKLTENFRRNMTQWLERFERSGVKFVFVLDTPLMAKVTAVETCALQQFLWAENNCTVSLAQDLRTRRKQDVVFRYLERRFSSDVQVVDPVATLYAVDGMFNPISAEGSYRMTDWNHLTIDEALRLREPLEHVIFGAAKASDRKS